MDQKLYKRFSRVKDRCYNPNYRQYHRYGGRGIKVCPEWLNNYSAFEEWAFKNGYSPELELDRIDNNGDYAPDNCRFVTKTQNNRNKENNRYYTINGVKRNLSEWCEIYGMKWKTVSQRLEKGMPIEKALTKPVVPIDKTSLLGKTYGILTVIAYDDTSISRTGTSEWICKCACGNITIIQGTMLKLGRKKSCGCLRYMNNKKRREMLNDSDYSK